MSNNYDQKAIREELERIHTENDLMRKLGSKLGFFQYYFDQLKNHRNQYECFNWVNEKYYDFFGEYRYDNYDSFRKQFNKNTHLLN